MTFIIKGNKIGTATVRQITPLLVSVQSLAPPRAKTQRNGYASPANDARIKGPKRQDREGDEQTSVIAEFALRHPQYGDLLIHIPNGGYRKNAFEGYRLRAQGVRKGVSDLYLPVARGGFFGLWIEFKASPPYASKVSLDQQEWINRMLAQGYEATVCKGTDAALAALAAYLALPPTLSVISKIAQK